MNNNNNIKYFAYGSNMDKDDFDKWCANKGHEPIEFLSIKPAKLLSYKLSFNYYSKSRGSRASNIMYCKNEKVYGLLIEIKENELFKLRKKEGYPYSYEEIFIEVVSFDKIIYSNVLTYKVLKEKEEESIEKPSPYYLNLIIKNAMKYNFPDKYLRYLENFK